MACAKRMGYKTIISDFRNFKIFEILRFNIFYIYIFFFKNPPKFQIFKNRNICTRRDSKECMYQVSSNYLQRRGFYSTLNVKNGYFSGHLAVVPCISIYIHLIPISMQQKMF